MNITLETSDLCLARRQLLRLSDSAGVRIEARSGSVWVTQDHDLRDVVLHPGESFTIDSAGRALVQAFEPSRIALSAAQSSTRGLAQHAGWPAGAQGRGLPQAACA